ncbi:MAG: DUF4412 domain-containing protein [Kiritimatiellae bacterium]|nr:DUF4412 domain-containing protein [Kiritimatiellia bacterium]
MRKLMVWLVLSVAVAATCRAGWEYTAVTQVQGQGRQAGQQGGKVQAWVAGDNARIAFIDSQNQMMKKGTYMVTRDAGKMVYLVDTEKKTYVKWDMKQMMGAAGGMMNMARGMMQMKFSEPKVEKLLEEAGDKIVGYATTHYRFRTSYTMEMSFMGQGSSTTTIQEEDIWSTTALDEPGFGLWLKKEDMQTGDKELDALIKAQMEKVEGFPLRRKTVTRTRDNRGQENVTSMTMEVTELKKSEPAADLFEIPAGYRETSMFEAMGMPPGGPGGPGVPPGGPGGPGGPPGQGGEGAENPFLKMMEQMQKRQQQ